MLFRSSDGPRGDPSDRLEVRGGPGPGTLEVDDVDHRRALADEGLRDPLRTVGGAPGPARDARPVDEARPTGGHVDRGGADSSFAASGFSGFAFDLI